MCLTAYVRPCCSTHCLHASADTHWPWCKRVPPGQKQPSVGVSIHADWLPLATHQSLGNVCRVLQSSMHPVRHASYSMELGHCNATTNRPGKSLVLFNLGVSWTTCTKNQLTAEVGAPPVNAHTPLPTDAGIGRNKLAHVWLLARLLLTLGKKHLDRNVRVAGFEHLRTQGLASHCCPSHTDSTLHWYACCAIFIVSPVWDKPRLVFSCAAIT